MLELGCPAPDFDLLGIQNKTFKLSDYNGKFLLLYFYPKDSTPGCTTQAKDFSTLQTEFEKRNCSILGVSRDSLKRHQNFIEKQNLTIDLASDEEGIVTETYGVWKEKSMYGKAYMGIERSSFLIDADGKILQIWSKVRVKGHAQAILDDLDQR